MEQISNELLSITVNDAGAEMQSLKHLPSGKELLWQGDPQYWEGRSPILFPAVGGLWNKAFRSNGHTYPLAKHGFMREKVWTLAEKDNTSITYIYRDKGEDRASFPWPYEIKVKYSICGHCVKADFSVKNTGDSPMYFQLGGHPGFTLPDFEEGAETDGYLQLSGTPTHVVRAGEQGCIEPGTFDVPQTADGLVPLCVDTFANEALIFENHMIDSVKILDKNRQPIVSVRSTSPVWLFWSPQGIHTPFICAEPWYGLCDHVGFTGDISERPYINCAQPGETWHGEYEIEVLV